MAELLERCDWRFVAVAPDTPIETILRMLPAERAERLSYYVVFAVRPGRYRVVRWDEIERLARDYQGDPRTTTIIQLAGKAGTVSAIPATRTPRQAEYQRSQQVGGRLVVLDAAGAPYGLLVGDTARAAADPGADPFERPTMLEADIGDVSFGGPVGAMPAAGESPGVLGPGERGTPTAGAQPPAPAAAPADTRVINLWIADHPLGQPLERDTTYELKLNVDEKRADTLAPDARPLGLDRVFDLTEDLIELEVYVDADPERILVEPDAKQVLRVPRMGRSRNNITYNITPLKDGPCDLRVLVFGKGRRIQTLTVTLAVGAQATAAGNTVRAAGWDVPTMLALKPRPNPLNLVIYPGTTGFVLRLSNGQSARAALNLTASKVAELVREARDVLKELVHAQDGSGRKVYQAGVDIPPVIADASLRKLAELGYYLYQELFFGTGSDSSSQAIGRALRQFSTQKTLNIEVVAESFIFPWGLLYDRDPLDLDAVDPQGFWGFRHVIEHLPESNPPAVNRLDPEIAVADRLQLSFIFNAGIDRETRLPIIENQRRFFQGLEGVAVTELSDEDSVLKALANPDLPAQFLYFYCHAESVVPGESGTTADSRLILTSAANALTLRRLKTRAPLGEDRVLKAAPLVFINACQSAELSPYLYDGLVPYLVARGARGVLGTEVDTPALFAAAFARAFFERWLKGEETLGETLLALRQEFLTKHKNPMGLVYALYSPGEVRLARTRP